MTHSPQTRQVTRLMASQPSMDGDGVRIQRLHDFGGGLDPFLMLDELGAEGNDATIGGFPPHPHRGIQTLTYVLHGGLAHEDHMGHASTIRAGDAQWMHTGRGVVHSEMPLTDARGLHAFQLWLNLAARDKLSPATYRDVRAGEMPRIDGHHATLIALGGRWQSASGQVLDGPLEALAGQGAVAHARLAADGELTLHMAATTLLVYVFAGTLEIAGRSVAQGQLAQLGSGERLTLGSREGAQALLLAGEPHGEPIAHYGPFVMNSPDEIEQAVKAYREGTLTD
mgnify:CR=1 FL=1